jgi:hypothetical protein
MAAFTFYGTVLKCFRVGFDPEQGLVVSRCASREECVRAPSSVESDGRALLV